MQLIETPVGLVVAGAVDAGICLLKFADRDLLQRWDKMCQASDQPAFSVNHAHLEQLREELQRYFSGALKDFAVPVAPRGTPFQQTVWAELRQIPCGQTIAYAELARRIGRPTAMRAVARANGQNPVSVLIPCHRVIGKDGSLTGYSGGLWRKRLLLELEQTGSLPGNSPTPQDRGQSETMTATSLVSICNYLPISEQLSTAGQPTEAEFAAIGNAGFELVVNLALATSDQAIPHEAALVEQLGMEHVHIPVLWEAPQLADLERFFAVMEANRNRKVFVHCAKNMRVAVFVYLYRVLQNHSSDPSARADLMRIWQPNATWQGFIDQAMAHYRQMSEPMI